MFNGDKENFEAMLDYLCKAIRETRASGGNDNNPLDHFKIVYDKDGYPMYVYPVFADGTGNNGNFYPIYVSGDSAIAMIMDINKQFITQCW